MSRRPRWSACALACAGWIGILATVSPCWSADAAPPQAPGSSGEQSDLEKRIRDLEERVRALSEAVESLKASSAVQDNSRILELERQIDLLTQEIERLKLGEAAAPEAEHSVGGLGPAASKVYQVHQGVSLGGYGELVYQDFSPRSDDGAPSGKTDTLDLSRAVFYFGYKWNERILFNSEIEFEHATTGEGDEEKGEVSVEFAYLEFLLRKRLQARAGLLLVPVGLINEMHEPTTFHGVLRPEVERRILPSTWEENGAGVVGEAGKFTYRAYLLAGLDATGFSAEEGLREGRQGGSQSEAKDLALAARMDLTGVPSLLAGISAYSGKSGQGKVPGGARVEIMDVHLQYQWRGIELRGLWAGVAIDNAASINEVQGIPPGSADSIGERLRGWYGQAAWDLMSFREGAATSLTPFLRFESLDTQDEVPAGYARNPANAERRVTFGVSWKPIPQVVLKADYQDVRNGAGSGVDQFNLGLGWIF
jgi:uncharacterized small protein (DUF1192 family)